MSLVTPRVEARDRLYACTRSDPTYPRALAAYLRACAEEKAAEPHPFVAHQDADDNECYPAEEACSNQP